MGYRDILYARISLDRKHQEKGITRQLEDGRALSAAMGGTVVAELYDNDISATKGLHREDYEELIQLVRAGEADRVIVWQTSRLWRNRRERAEGIEIFGRMKISVIACEGPSLDLATAGGRMLAGILGEFDTAEAEVHAERIRREAQQRAEIGKAHGRISYGLRRERETDANGKTLEWHDVILEDEAAIIREITRRILAGEALKAIASDLNERHVPARTKGGWTGVSVRKVAVRPVNAGLRPYHLGKEDERLIPSEWEHIVSADDFHRVVTLLNDPTRSNHRPGRQIHLLTARVAECGVCGQGLRIRRDRQDRFLYICRGRGCVGRDQRKLDALVRQTVIEILSRADAADLLRGDASASVEALQRSEALRAQLDEAAGAFARSRITMSQLTVITAALEPQIAATEAEAARLRPSAFSPLVAGMLGERAAAAWDGLAVTQRREVIRFLGLRIRVMPARSTRVFHPEDVIIEPRTMS